MTDIMDILNSKPMFENDKERDWYVGHYRIKQMKNKHGNMQDKFYVFDRTSEYYNTIAFASFYSKFYLSKFLDLLGVIQEMRI